MGKSQGNLRYAPLLPIPRSWEHCLPISLDCLPVQSFHNTTVNFQSSCKCHLSRQRWWKTTSHGILFWTLGNVSFLQDMVLQLHDQWPGHAFHHKKCFYKWCPDSNLFGLQLHWNFRETSSASGLSHMRTAPVSYTHLTLPTKLQV